LLEDEIRVEAAVFVACVLVLVPIAASFDWACLLTDEVRAVFDGCTPVFPTEAILVVSAFLLTDEVREEAAVFAACVLVLVPIAVSFD